jgi:hypothetical protein
VRDTPVVILGYNRPDKVERLLDCLREQRPSNVIFSIDGPKSHIAGDADKVAAVQALAEGIDWTDRVETIFRDANVGLQIAVTEAVTHAVNSYGQAIILEEDTLPGADWLPYAGTMLERHRGDSRIEHISGYNLVPPKQLTHGTTGSRLSRYPESIAWATWDRAWNNFDSTLDWALNASIADLTRITGSRAGALRWKQNFADAAAGRISTWAYRWICSMWSRDAYVLSPNANLVTYAGYDAGTHTVMNAPWSELELFDGELSELTDGDLELDEKADEWVGRTVFAETAYGVSRGVAISAALAARKRYRAYKRTRANRG